MEYLIYDYETLGQNTQTLPIVSVAFLKFNTDRFESNPYSYSELLIVGYNGILIMPAICMAKSMINHSGLFL